MATTSKPNEAQLAAAWAEGRSFTAKDRPEGSKFYELEMFPYPSGELHMGHMRNYAIGDVIARYHRMRGDEVLHPMGFDAFGLPAENAAIKRGVHPAEWTEANIATMIRQMKRMGFSYDWSRTVSTHTPEYYRWTQWLFLLLWERGLAYKKEAHVNWCPDCATVLANEQVVHGACWRCGAEVTKKTLSQWFLKITAYADRLVDDLAALEGWPERVKIQQENWVGRSHGTELSFQVAGTDQSITVFTTRPDTLFGVTYVVAAPEHPVIETLSLPEDAAAFRRRMMTLGDLERTEGEKIGVATGHDVVHPFTGERLPLLIANYVLGEYGTGAVMGVPAHDQRDFEFATQYGLPIKRVIVGAQGGEGPLTEADTELGTLIDSGPFTGRSSKEAMEAIGTWAEGEGKGRTVTHYRLRDWLISRQRYWGAPIPMVECARCGHVPVPKEQLPVLLPETAMLQVPGVSPLEAVEGFVHTTCPQCGGAARRETDTMDTFMDSSWYYLRYVSASHGEAAFDSDKANAWLPVDQYVGGIEHAVLHLLYSRFITKVLHDADLVDFVEPFTNLLTQGMVTKDGSAMSKSKGNVVSPIPMVERYGADTVRLFILFASPPERDLEWSENGVEGAQRFLARVERLYQLGLEPGGRASRENGEEGEDIRKRTARAIDRVERATADRFSFNTAIAQMMELVNFLYQRLEARRSPAFRESLRALCLLMAPYAPFTAERLWTSELAEEGPLWHASWPTFDPSDLVDDTVEVAVQINGKLRGRLEVPRGLGREALADEALSDERVSALLEGRTPRRVVAVVDRIVNIVL